MKAYVIYSDSRGVFVGAMFGLGFWAKWDSAGQPCAPAVQEYEDAAETLLDVAGDVKDARLVQVDVSKSDRATIAECVAAGLPAWDPNEVPEGIGIQCAVVDPLLVHKLRRIARVD